MKIPHLFQKILTVQSSVFILIFLTLPPFSAWHHYQQLIEHRLDLGILTVQQVAHFLSEGSNLMQHNPLIQQSVWEAHDIAYIVVIDQNNHKILTHPPNLAAIEILNRTVDRSIPNPEYRLQQNSLVTSVGEMLEIQATLSSNPIWHIHVGFYKHSLYAQLVPLILSQMGWLLLLFLLNLYLSYRILSALSKDLLELTENVQQVQNHQFDLILEMDPKQHEIGYLVEAFKVMVAEIRNHSYNLSQSEERFRIITQTIPIPLFLTRPLDGRILYANPQATELFRLSASELIRDYYIYDLYSFNPEQTYYETQTLIGPTKWIHVHLKPLTFNGQQAMLNILHDFTVRKQEEQTYLNFTQQLEKNERKYRALFELANDAILILENDVIIDCNPKALTLFNCDREYLIGKHPSQLSPPYQPDGTTSQDKALRELRTASSGEIRIFEWAHQTKEGVVFKVEVTLSKLNFDNKHYLQAILRDLTDRYHAESQRLHYTKELQESEDRFQVIAETTPMPIIITRVRDNVIVYANEQASMAFSLLSTELTGQQLGDLFLTEPAWQGVLKQQQRDGFLYNYETQMRKVDGTPMWVTLFSQPTLLKEEPVNVNTIYDITERKKAEEERTRFTVALKQSEERFRVIAETTPIPIFITLAKDGLIIYANLQAERMYGVVRLENGYGSQSIIDFYVDPSERQKVTAIAANEGRLDNYELQLKTANSGFIWAELSVQPIQYGDDKAFVVAVYDITQRKKAEEERLFHIQQTNQLNESLIELLVTNTELNNAYERFVPYAFLQLLDKENVIEVKLGDQVEKDMTILFADIRGFTALSEKMTPQENFNFINSYLSQMEPIITQHNGFIDKYIGDAIMALFPTADDGLQGAIAMLLQLENYNGKRRTLGLADIKVGIGINTGKLMLGTVGGENRMDGTVIGDAVNLASRVEGLTKSYHIPLLISEYTYRQLDNPLKYHIRVIDRVKVKGKSQPITFYEVFDIESAPKIALKLSTLQDFEQGFHAYQQKQYREAFAAFEKVLENDKYDKVAQIYLERCSRASGMNSTLY